MIVVVVILAIVEFIIDSQLETFLILKKNFSAKYLSTK